MNTVLFSFKRIFHKSIQFGKALLHPFRLTPSRFDMLHVIFLHNGMIRRTRLCEILGVTGSTVGRMLKSLEELGFLLRCRVLTGDLRQRDIILTEEGSKRISAAMLLMFENRFCEVETQKIVVPRSRDLEVVREAWRKLDAQLARIRTEFGDQSAMHYPWTRGHRATALFCLAA